MSYEKYYSNGWADGESGATPITADALNHMEAGIVDANTDTETYGISLPSTVAATTIELVKRGGVAMLSIVNITALPAGQTTICTLSSEWRPALRVMHAFSAPNSVAGPFRVDISTAGVLSIYNYGSAVTASSNASDVITYVLA